MPTNGAHWAIVLLIQIALLLAVHRWTETERRLKTPLYSKKNICFPFTLLCSFPSTSSYLPFIMILYVFVSTKWVLWFSIRIIWHIEIHSERATQHTVLLLCINKSERWHNHNLFIYWCSSHRKHVARPAIELRQRWFLVKVIWIAAQQRSRRGERKNVL